MWQRSHSLSTTRNILTLTWHTEPFNPFTHISAANQPILVTQREIPAWYWHQHVSTWHEHAEPIGHWDEFWELSLGVSLLRVNQNFANDLAIWENRHHTGTDSTYRFWTSLTHFDLDLEHTTPHCMQWPEHCIATQPWLYTTQKRSNHHEHDPQKDTEHFW